MDANYELKLLRKIEGLREQLETLQELQNAANRRQEEHEQAARSWEAERKELNDAAGALREKVGLLEVRARDRKDTAVQTLPEASTSTASVGVATVGSPKTPKTKTLHRDVHAACERTKNGLQKRVNDLESKLSHSQLDIGRLERILDEGAYWSPTRASVRRRRTRRGDETPTREPTPSDSDYIDSRASITHDTSQTMEGDDEPLADKEEDASEQGEGTVEEEGDEDEAVDEDDEAGTDEVKGSDSGEDDEGEDSEGEPGRRRSKRLRKLPRKYYGRPDDVESAAPSVEAQTPTVQEEPESGTPDVEEDSPSLGGWLVDDDDEVEYERSSRRTRKREISTKEDEDAGTDLVHKTPSQSPGSAKLQDVTNATMSDAPSDADQDDEDDEREEEISSAKCLACEESGFTCIRVSSRKACRSCHMRKRACELPPTLTNLLNLEASDDMRPW